MTDIKHSPGPWRLGHLDGSFREIDSAHHGALATVVWQMSDDADAGVSSPHCEANARLIVAAPRMYDLLRDLAKRGSADAKALLREIDET